VSIGQRDIFDGLLQQQVAAWEQQINGKASDYAVKEIRGI
jgi:hypothetical protein